MAEHVEMIAKALYELDRQKGLRSHRWLPGQKRNETPNA
jgi:hypothetical protein